MPNLRPSAAIRTACSVASAVSGSAGAAGQTLCASSIDDQHRPALAPPLPERRAAPPRRRAPAPRAWAASRGRRPGSARRDRRAPSSTEPASSRAQTPQSSTPRLRDAQRAARAPRRGRRPRSSASALRAAASASSAASSAYSSRSAIGSSRSSAAWRRAIQLGEPQPQARVAAGRGRAHGDPAGERRPALRRAGVGAAAHLAQAHEVRVGVEDDDPQVGLQQQLLEHARRARSVLPEPDWPHRNVWRSKPPASSAERTPSTQRQVADGKTRAARRGGLAATRAPPPASPGAPRRRGTASAPRSRITPSPRASRIGSRVRMSTSPAPLGRERDLARVDLPRASERTWPRRRPRRRPRARRSRRAAARGRRARPGRRSGARRPRWRAGGSTASISARSARKVASCPARSMPVIEQASARRPRRTTAPTSSSDWWAATRPVTPVCPIAVPGEVLAASAM